MKYFLILIFSVVSLVSAEYEFSTYSDNWAWWSNGKQFPQVPEGVMVDLAFGVVKGDGTLDPRYPIDPNQKYDPVQGIPPTPPGCTGLGIGGWNDSISGGGLYQVMRSTDPKVVKNAATSIVSAAIKYKYSRIVIDYEDYSGQDLSVVKPNFMNFVDLVATTAHAAKIEVAMTISPDPKNQKYYDLGKIAGIVDWIQVMCYDYSRGSATVAANADVAQTKAYLSQIVKVVKDQSKLSVGIPFYGLQFDVTPNQPASQVQSALKAGKLTSTGQEVINDDVFLKSIGGNWANPGGDWKILGDGKKIQNIFYYSQHYGHITSVMSPAAMKDFATMMKKSFPKVNRFFAWEAQGDMSGEMMRAFITAMNAKVEADATEELDSL